MTTTAAPPVGLPAHPAPATAQRWYDPGPVLAAGASFSAVVLLVAVGGLVVDDRVITGAPAWLKPAKFGVSITVYLLTLRWVVSHVQGFRRTVRAISWVSAVGLAVELAFIAGQVVRGTTSHFNETTPLDEAMYQAMGGLIATIFLVTVVLGALVLRRSGLDAGLAAGLRWGLWVSLLGMSEAVLMTVNETSDPTGGHTVGAADGGAGMLMTGWSLEHGDLRVAHFVGLHALQALPLLAWVLARWTGLDQRTRARLVAVAGSAQAGLVVLLAWQALRGQALLRPDAVTLAAAAGLLGAAAAGAAVVLGRRAVSGPAGPGRR